MHPPTANDPCQGCTGCALKDIKKKDGVHTVQKM